MPLVEALNSEDFISTGRDRPAVF